MLQLAWSATSRSVSSVVHDEQPHDAGDVPDGRTERPRARPSALNGDADLSPGLGEALGAEQTSEIGIEVQQREPAAPPAPVAETRLAAASISSVAVISWTDP